MDRELSSEPHCLGAQSSFSGKGLSPAATPCAAPHSPGEVSPNPSPPAPRRSMAATSSHGSAARPVMELLRLPPVSVAPSRPILRRFASSNPSRRSGAFPPTNRFAKGFHPSRRQGCPRFSLCCKPGDPPPLTTHTPRSPLGKVSCGHDPFPTEEGVDVERVGWFAGVGYGSGSCVVRTAGRGDPDHMHRTMSV